MKISDSLIKCARDMSYEFCHDFIRDIISMKKVRKYTTDENRYWKRDSNFSYDVLIIPLDNIRDEKTLKSSYEEYLKMPPIIQKSHRQKKVELLKAYEIYQIYFDDYGNHMCRHVVPYQGGNCFDWSCQVDLNRDFSDYTKFKNGDVVRWSRESTREYAMEFDLYERMQEDGIDTLPLAVDLFPVKELERSILRNWPTHVSEVHVSELTPIRKSTCKERQMVEELRF